MLTKITAAAGGQLIIAAALLGWPGGARQGRPAGALPRLTDVTQSAGIKFLHVSSRDKKYIVESMSGGYRFFISARSSASRCLSRGASGASGLAAR